MEVKCTTNLNKTYMMRKKIPFFGSYRALSNDWVAGVMSVSSINSNFFQKNEHKEGCWS